MRNIPGRTSSAVITVKNPDGSPAAEYTLKDSEDAGEVTLG